VGLSPGTHARLGGLDTLRALAIAFVFAHHYQLFVSREATFGAFGTVGWVGVDLFFVLSGYLIAYPLLAAATADEPLAPGRFYARRWLRTLPVFWVVLAAYQAWPEALGGRVPPPAWRFLSFTQNVNLQPGTAFSHAWSLCVEEQFYLLLPPVLLVGVAAGAGRRAGWAAIAALTALGIGARAWLWTRHGRESTDIAGYHPAIYYASLCRFDELLPGVALALLRATRPRAWAALMARGAALFWWGLVVVLAGLWAVRTDYYLDGYGYSFEMTAFGYSAVAWSFALLVASALSPASPLARWRVPGAQTLALWSYALYLTHKAVGHVVAQALPVGTPPALVLAAVTAACLAVAALLYLGVERPVMRWRDRHVPSAPRTLVAAAARA
jgi:peptidoglycan/LPS O-acetylase OafA/YrhL